jgi:hypothetical protein
VGSDHVDWNSDAVSSIAEFVPVMVHLLQTSTNAELKFLACDVLSNLTENDSLDNSSCVMFCQQTNAITDLVNMGTDRSDLSKSSTHSDMDILIAGILRNLCQASVELAKRAVDSGLTVMRANLLSQSSNILCGLSSESYKSLLSFSDAEITEGFFTSGAFPDVLSVINNNVAKCTMASIPSAEVIMLLFEVVLTACDVADDNAQLKQLVVKWRGLDAMLGFLAVIDEKFIKGKVADVVCSVLDGVTRVLQRFESNRLEWQEISKLLIEKEVWQSAKTLRLSAAKKVVVSATALDDSLCARCTNV